MVFQQNAISSEAPASTRTRIHFHRTMLAVLLIAGITLLLSLYVYQASVNYSAQMQIQRKKQEYAQEQRLLAAKLQTYGAAQSIEKMAQRAKAAGYAPPKPSQIRYVLKDTGKTFSLQQINPNLTARR